MGTKVPSSPGCIIVSIIIIIIIIIVMVSPHQQPKHRNVHPDLKNEWYRQRVHGR